MPDSQRKRPSGVIVPTALFVAMFVLMLVTLLVCSLFLVIFFDFFAKPIGS